MQTIRRRPIERGPRRPRRHFEARPAARGVAAAVWLLLAAVLLGLPSSPGAAAAEPAVESESEGAAADGSASDGSSEDPPVGVKKEVLFVQDSLPFVPTSNTIATKLPVELAWTPANVGVVGSELLEEQGSRVLTDALENVSGINVQTFSGIFDFFVVRGFDSVSGGLVLTDGAPEPEATFYQMYNAERVEVFKGPAGFLYGSNPLAGAVNIVRKQPVPADFGRAGVSAGSFSTYEAQVDVNQASAGGELSFRLNGLWRESDGHRDFTDSEATAVNPALTWKPSERSRLNLNFEYLESDYRPDAGIPVVEGGIPEIDRERSYASPFDFSEQRISRFQIDYENRLSDRLAVRNKLYLRQLDWETDGTLLVGVFPTPFGDQVARSLLLLDDDQQFWGDQIELLWSAETGRVQHDLLFGVELARYTDAFTLDVGLLPLIGLDDPVETAERPIAILPGQSSAGDAESVIVAPYVVDQITLSERLQVMLGARFDTIDFEDPVRGVSRSDGELSPIAGIAWSPIEGLSLYANAARSFAPPSPRASGGPEPEESTQIEAGVRRSWREGRIRATFALYQLDRENIAIPDDNGFTQQVGDQRSRGFETELSADLPGGLRGLLSYAYNDAELTEFSEFVVLPTNPPVGVRFDRSGNSSAFAPEHLARLWVSKRLGNGMRLGGGARFVGDQFIAEDNVTTIDSHLLLDAAVSYTLGDWRLTAHVENLTDEDYQTRGFGSTSVIPGAPAAIYLGVERRF